MQKMKLNLQYFASNTIDGSWTASGNGSGTCDCRIKWSSSVIEGTNQSKVTASIQVYKSGSSSTSCTFEGSIKIDGTSYSISKYDSWSWGTWHTIGSKTKTVTHNEDGTKSISISGSVKTADGTTTMSGTYKASGTAKLDDINRASKLGEIDNFGIADTITIPITKYVSTFTDTLVISYGDTTIKTISNITDGYELTFSGAEQSTIKSLMKSPQIALTFTLTTLNDATTLGSSVQSAVVTSLDQPVFRHVIQKENGKYQVAFNGLVDESNDAPLQVYDDEGNLFNGRVSVPIELANSNFSGGCNYYPALGLCYCRLYITGKAFTTGTRHIVATIPEPYQPSFRIALSIDGLQDYSSDLRASISSSGEIGFVTASAKASGDDIYIAGVWYVSPKKGE